MIRKYHHLLSRKTDQWNRYTVAYAQYFDKEIERNNGDWKKVLKDYLFPGPEPLINGFAGGRRFPSSRIASNIVLTRKIVGHPFIHLAYAWELHAPTVASEALSLGCTEIIEVHGLLDNYPPDNSTYKTSSLGDVIKRVHDDKRFDGLFEYQGITNVEGLMKERIEAVLEHWNAWEVTDPLAQLENCCDVSTLLAIATGDREKKYDFYLIHTMTVAHALCVLWELFPEDQQVCILRQYALFVIINYICQIKPKVDFGLIEQIESVQLQEADTWDSLVSKALQHKWMKDSHFFKVFRALKVFEETYGSKRDFYRKASAKFLTEFDGWEGFGLGVEGFLPNRDGYIPESE